MQRTRDEPRQTQRATLHIRCERASAYNDSLDSCKWLATMPSLIA